MTTFAATARNARTADLVEEWGVDFTPVSVESMQATIAELREGIEDIDRNGSEWVSAWVEAEGAYDACGAGTHLFDFLAAERERMEEELADIESTLAYILVEW